MGRVDFVTRTWWHWISARMIVAAHLAAVAAILAAAGCQLAAVAAYCLAGIALGVSKPWA